MRLLLELSSLEIQILAHSKRCWKSARLWKRGHEHSVRLSLSKQAAIVVANRSNHFQKSYIKNRKQTGNVEVETINVCRKQLSSISKTSSTRTHIRSDVILIFKCIHVYEFQTYHKCFYCSEYCGRKYAIPSCFFWGDFFVHTIVAGIHNI